MKQEQIRSMESKVRKEYGNITGIVVLQDGHTVYEKYFNDCSQNEPVHVFSVTKSIISMLFGIALDQGYINSLDEKVIDFFSDYHIRKKEKTIQHITIRNLLNMTAPYRFRLHPYPRFFSSEDWVMAALGLLGGNGKIGNFRYAPVIGPDILSGILIHTTGQSVLEFAQNHLFSPLEISVKKNIYFHSKEEQMHFHQSRGINGWVVDPNGTNTAGWGLCLTTMDMAKLGQLYLNGGNWKGRQIVSGEWTAESTQVQSVWKARHLKYGYLWWVIDEEEHSFAALGDGGNAVYVNPKAGIVAAVSSLFAPRVKDRIDFIKSEIEPLFA